MLLVGTIKRRLDISAVQAAWRLAVMAICFTVFVASFGFMVYFFQLPAEKTYFEELLPVAYTQFDEIVGGDVLAGRDQFLSLAEGKHVVVDVEEWSAVYLIESDGMSFRYEQQLSASGAAWYSVADYEVLEAGILYHLHRELWLLMSILFVVWGIFCTFFFAVAVKEDSGRMMSVFKG